MWEEGPTFSKGQLVKWVDESKRDEYESGDGPFRVVHSRLIEWAPVCTCGERGNSLLNKHRPFCEINVPAEGFAVTVEMSGRLRTFPEEWFKLAAKPGDLV